MLGTKHRGQCVFVAVPEQARIEVGQLAVEDVLGKLVRRSSSCRATTSIESQKRLAGVLAFLRKFFTEHRCQSVGRHHDATILGDNAGQAGSERMASTAISYGHGAPVAQTISADKKRARIVEALRSDRQTVEDALWLAELPLVHQDEHRIFVHAGLRPGVALVE